MNIKVKFFNDTYEGENALVLPSDKQNWVDLRASANTLLEKGDFVLIPLGIAMQLPKGYEAHIVPRSSTFKNFGIIQTNHMGVIDETYCGDNDQWFFPAFCIKPNSDDGLTRIYKGDRICQFRIVERQPRFEVDIVEHLDNKDRGGHGSTGIK